MVGFSSHPSLLHLDASSFQVDAFRRDGPVELGLNGDLLRGESIPPWKVVAAATPMVKIMASLLSYSTFWELRHLLSQQCTS